MCTKTLLLSALFATMTGMLFNPIKEAREVNLSSYKTSFFSQNAPTDDDDDYNFIKTFGIIGSSRRYSEKATAYQNSLLSAYAE